MTPAKKIHLRLLDELTAAAKADREVFKYAPPAPNGSTRIFISHVDGWLEKLAAELAELDQFRRMRSDDML